MLKKFFVGLLFLNPTANGKGIRIDREMVKLLCLKLLFVMII